MKHIPNLLSCLRIVLIPFFVLQMMQGNTPGAAIILAVSGLTDMLDGGLARRFGWITQLGKVLDPIADKLTQLTVCVVLAVHLRKYWPFFLILLLKELVMMAGGGYLMSRGVKIEGAKWCGKLATILFYVSMTLIVMLPQLSQMLVYTMLSLAVASSLLAIILYIPEFLRYHRGQKRL